MFRECCWSLTRRGAIGQVLFDSQRNNYTSGWYIACPWRNVPIFTVPVLIFGDSLSFRRYVPCISDVSWRYTAVRSSAHGCTIMMHARSLAVMFTLYDATLSSSTLSSIWYCYKVQKVPKVDAYLSTWRFTNFTCLITWDYLFGIG